MFVTVRSSLAFACLLLVLTACAQSEPPSSGAAGSVPTSTEESGAPSVPDSPVSPGAEAPVILPSNGPLSTADYLLMNAQALTRFFNGQKPLGLRVSLKNGRFMNEIYVYAQPSLSETRSTECELVAPPGISNGGLAVRCEPFQVTSNKAAEPLPTSYSPGDFGSAAAATMKSFDHWFRAILKPRPSDHIVAVKVWQGGPDKLYSLVTYQLEVEGKIEERSLNHWCHIYDSKMDCHPQKPPGPNEP